MIKTAPENSRLINKMYYDLEALMMNLYSRWQDEKEYEDIEDYAKAIRLVLPAGVVMTKMKKRPFGFEFTLAGLSYFVKVTANEYSWGRTK